MKKSLLMWLSISIVLLSGCLVKKNLDPEEVLRETQANLVDKIFDSGYLLEMKRLEEWEKWGSTGNLTVGLSLNGEELEAKFDIKGLSDADKGFINVTGVANFNFREISGEIQANADMVMTYENLFFRVNSLKTNLSDPSLQAQIDKLKIFLKKRFYLDLSIISEDISKQAEEAYFAETLKMKKLLKENSLLKVANVFGERLYKVKLNHKNITKIVTELSDFPVDQNEFELRLSNWIDIDAIINIKENNLYFILSGYLLVNKSNERLSKLSWKKGLAGYLIDLITKKNEQIQKEPFKLEYLKNKFLFETKNFKLDFDLKDSVYSGYILIGNELNQLKIIIKVKVSEDNFSMRMDIPQRLFSFFLETSGDEPTQLETVEIKIPENAINIEEVLGVFHGIFR